MSTSPDTTRLGRLTHEQLVGEVAARLESAGVGVGNEQSRYLSDASVPALRITPYPKRRRQSRATRVVRVALSRGARELTYQDFIDLATVESIAS